MNEEEVPQNQEEQIDDIDAINSEQGYIEQEQLEQELIEGDDQPLPKRRRGKKTADKEEDNLSSSWSENSEDIFDDNYIIDKLPKDKNKLVSLLAEVKQRIKEQKLRFLKEENQMCEKKSFVADTAVPICADVTKFDFENLIKKQLQITQRAFDVIMMDPPWRLSTSQPSRGVAIQYCSLSDELIEQIPVPILQTSGFLFIWVINAKFQFTVNLMEKKWGYKVVDSINWVKKTVNGKIAKGHGFYLQHAKETCLVGFKGDFKGYNKNMPSDVIFSERRGQSQKPTQIYEYIQSLVPNGYYLQIFGRRNNLRANWVTLGNQL